MNALQSEWDRIRRSALARNASWMFLGQGLSVVCQGLYFILLARLLGPTQYGIYVGVFATTAILSVYAPLGSAFTLLRHVSPAPEKFAAYWGNVLMTTLALGSIFTVVLVLVVPHLAHSYSWKIVVCAAVSDCLCAQLTDACSRVFQTFEKPRFTAALSLLNNLLRTVLAGTLLWHIHQATAQQWAVAALAVSLIGVTLAVTLVTRNFGTPIFRLGLLRQRTGEGIVFAVSSSASGIYNNFDKAMLGHYGMNAATGIYAMAYRVVDIATIPIQSVHWAAFPRFFKKGTTGIHSTGKYALQILRRTGPMALLLAAAMALAAPVIPHLVGKGFGQSVLALRWLCLLPVFRSFQLSAGDALTGAGHLRLRVGLQVVAAIFNFSVNLYLIPHYGWIGAAWSSLATDGLLAVANWVALSVLRAQAPTEVVAAEAS